MERFNDVKRQVLAKEREQSALLEDVSKMRVKMRDHLDKSSSEFIDIKQGRGGLVDIEFFVQYLVLLHSHQYPQLSEHSDNISLLEQLAAISVISELEQRDLVQGYCKLRDFGHHATLKNSPQMIPVASFASDYPNVTEIIDKVFK